MLDDAARTHQLHADRVDRNHSLGRRKRRRPAVLEVPDSVKLAVALRERTGTCRTADYHKDTVRSHVLQIRLRSGKIDGAESGERVRVDCPRLHGGVEHAKLPAAEISLRRHRNFHVLALVVGVHPEIVVGSENVHLVDPRPARRNGIENVVGREAATGVVVDGAVPLGRLPVGRAHEVRGRRAGSRVILHLEHVLHCACRHARRNDRLRRSEVA